MGNDSIARTFRDLILNGKVRDALRFLSRNTNGGILKLDELIPEKAEDGETEMRSVREILEDKHPKAMSPPSCTLLDNKDPLEPVNSILFDELSPETILQCALHTQGSAGPSGLDAQAWRRMCSSFKSASTDLCAALANVGKRIATPPVHPDGLSAFVACRLIPINKCPGVRPIGVGEVPRRIIAKAILRILKKEIEEAAGPLQLCAGQDGGCEAAVHAMKLIFQDESTQAALLVDAINAFNSINRHSALHNINVLCPPLAQVLVNTYRKPIRLFIQGSGELSSTEGTTQGDPLAMAMYAIAITPLMTKLKEKCPNVRQAWYADDATGASTCSDLRRWWDELTKLGPLFGYHPNPSKTYLVVKEEHKESATQTFMDTGVNITTEGKRHLGAAIGSFSFTKEYVSKKVREWSEEVRQLAHVAISQPHAAYAAFTHGLSGRWTYLLRTIPNVQDLFLLLENVIQQHFIPALTGLPPCSKLERDLLALPVRHGGLGIVNPTTLSSPYYQASELLTKPLVSLIVSQETNKSVDPATVIALKKDVRDMNRTRHTQQACTVKDQLPENLKRHAEQASEKGASSWLSVLPIAEHGFYLHKGEFRDALRLRYNWQLNNIPRTCNCGAQFTVNHAMVCHMGGFPTIRHNEVRDMTASLLTEVCHNVATEPPLQPLSGESFNARSANTDDNARLDIRCRGFWNNHQDAFFDVRVFYPNAPSNRSGDAYKRHEQAKKREYGERVRDIERGVFTPLVLSTNGGMGQEASTFYKRLADMIALKRKHIYSVVMGWLRCRLSFALIRSSVMCIRGSRSSQYRPVYMDSISLAAQEGHVPPLNF